MDIFAEVSNSMPKQDYSGTNSVKPQQANAPKMQTSNNASKNGSVNKKVDVVSISKNAQNKASKDFVKSSGSIEINNHRVKYSLTKNNDLVIQIIDKKSNEVVRQIPPEEMVKIREILAKILEQELQVANPSGEVEV